MIRWLTHKLHTRRRNKAFYTYLYKLGPALVDRYGASDEYSRGQIQTTIETLKLNLSFIDYAVALFGPPETPLTNHRQAIAQALFQGDVDYTARDVLQLSKSAGWKGGPSPSWWDNHFGKTSL